MNWATKRRVIYALTTTTTIVAIVLYVYRSYFFPEPTCVDRKMNGFEIGVDCGGVCALRCESEVAPLVVEWTRALKTSKTSYDLVAFVSNKNIDNAPRFVSYKFSVYDKATHIIFEKEGQTLVPVNSDFPIILQNIELKSEPAQVSIELSKENNYKTFEKPAKPTIRVRQPSFENGDIPRVYVTIVNTKTTSVKNIPIRVVLLDSLGNAIGVGERFLERLAAEEEKNLVFTWDMHFAEEPATIKVYPIMDPFVYTP